MTAGVRVIVVTFELFELFIGLNFINFIIDKISISN